MTWIKVKHPETSEIRSFINVIFDYSVYQHIKDCTKVIFQLDDDYDFYFKLIDEHSDKVTIKESYEVLDYIQRLSYTCLRLEIVPINGTAQEQQQQQQQQQEEPNLSESIQSLMKNLELGINSLQETVQKTALDTRDNVVKTAAETAAHVYRSLLPNQPQQQFDVICDGCYAPIRGQRYRCETCEDFDLCSACKCRVNHNPAHNFRLKGAPEQQQKSQATAAAAAAAVVVPIYICDFCDSDITGIRHTCNTCPDFDLCHPCYSIVNENHPNHTFATHLVGAQASNNARFTKQTKSCEKDSIPMQHRGVECDYCQSTIEGVRYKCGHCPDYDLCEQCEENAGSIHNPAHAFIKIKYPIKSLSRRPLLPKFKPMDSSNVEMTSSPSRSSTIISKPEEILTSRSVSSSSLPINEPQPNPTVNASFISDLNIPDGTVIVPKKSFIKMWKVKNTGNVEWPIGSHLLFNGGSILRPYPISRPDCFAVPVISPDEETCITAELQAPDSPGNYTSYFCLCTPDGQRFGDNLWCTIKVDEDLEPEKKPHTEERTNESVESNTPSLAASIMMNSSTMIYPTPSTTPSVSDHHQDDTLSVTTTGNTTTVTFTDSQVSSIESDSDRDSFADEEFSETVDEQVANNEHDDDFVIIDENTLDEYSNASSTYSNTTAKPSIHDSILYRAQLTQLHEMGFTNHDQVAVHLLKLYDGEIDKVISKLIEHSF